MCWGFPVWRAFEDDVMHNVLPILKAFFIALTGVNKLSSFVEIWIFIALRPRQLFKAIFEYISEFNWELIFVTYTSCPQFQDKQ